MAFLMLSLQPHATYLLLRRIREGISRTQTLKNIIHRHHTNNAIKLNLARSDIKQ